MRHRKKIIKRKKKRNRAHLELRLAYGRRSNKLIVTIIILKIVYIFAGKVDLKTSKTNKDKFERNQTDVFSLDADVGMLKKSGIILY